MIWLFKCFDYVPCLALHNCHLFGKHALLEVRILLKNFAESRCRATPPCSRRKEREEMIPCTLRERLSDQRHGQEEPTEGKAAPLHSSSAKSIEAPQADCIAYSIRMFPRPRQAVVDGADLDGRPRLCRVRWCARPTGRHHGFMPSVR